VAFEPRSRRMFIGSESVPKVPKRSLFVVLSGPQLRHPKSTVCQLDSARTRHPSTLNSFWEWFGVNSLFSCIEEGNHLETISFTLELSQSLFHNHSRVAFVQGETEMSICPQTIILIKMQSWELKVSALPMAD